MFRLLFRGYLVYLGVSLLVILPALNFLAPWFVNKSFERNLQTEIILFNPFRLAVEVRRATLPERDGEPFVGFSSAEVNLSLESIWSKGWVFDAIRLEGLYVDIKRFENGDFNFSDLLGAEEDSDPSEPQTESQSEIPGITIHDFFVHADWLKFTDEGRQKPFTTQYNGLEIAVNDLSTVREDGKPYSLDVRGEEGGVLHWEGEVSIPEAYSKGILSVSQLGLKNVSRFIEPWVNFDINQGTLGVKGHYQVNWDDGLQYRIDKALVSLSELSIAPQETMDLPQTGIKLGELLVSEVQVDGSEERVNIGSVALTDLQLSGWSEGNRVSLADLFAPKEDGAANPEPETEVENNWTIAVQSTTIANSKLQWRSEFTEPATLLISPFDTTVKNLNWPFEGDTEVAINLAINNQAKLNVDAKMALLTGRGQLSYTLADLPVQWFNPNLPKGADAAINKGVASTTGELSLVDFAPTRLTMDGAVTDFSITVAEVENAITGWQSVRWQQLDLNLLENSIAMNALFIDGYSGRLHIYQDGTINTQRALSEEAEKQEILVEQETSQVPQKPWSFSVPAITITDSKLDFMDESLPITFRTVIGDLNGDITGINSDPTSQTRVDLTGSVDGYAPVKLAGTAQPFTSPPDLDLALSFDGIDLSRLTPYSGTYAGHAIDRGILNLDLQYKLENARLDGSNSIIINQLKLGEKIDSDKAVDLPLGLAIALLTDLNGVIDLSVPVSGNVDDPEFNLGGVIFSTLVNIITKAVTAPFNLLAGLVSSEEDLQRVTFSSGSAELDAPAKAKLLDLSSALTQRPELVLIISGRLHPTADRQSLQKNTLKAELIASGLSAEQWQQKGPQWSEAIAQRYQALPIAEADGEEASVSEQYRRVIAEIPISDEALKELAEERTVQTKRFLVMEAKLPAERAVIETVKIEDKANLFSGVEMKIDT